jgi:flagellar biosynthesis protein FlhG
MDQSVELRRLLHTSGHPLGGVAAPPRLVVVSAGKIGVGSTTLAVNLSMALAGHGLRTLLIDADLSRAEVAAQCGLSDQPGIGEVLVGRRSIHEILARGPGGLQVVVGSSTSEARNACTERSVRRVVRQVQSLGRHADLVLIDAGASTSPATLAFWQAAGEVILVATPDAVTVMDTYATVKTLLTRSPVRPPLRLVVNQAADRDMADDVHERIDRSCRRFLGLEIPLATWLPLDPLVPAATRRGTPPFVAHPAGPLATAVDELAAEVLAARERPAHEQAAARQLPHAA